MGKIRSTLTLWRTDGWFRFDITGEGHFNGRSVTSRAETPLLPFREQVNLWQVAHSLAQASTDTTQGR